MKIVPIFVDDNYPGNGLFSAHFDGELFNEFETLFELWNDREFLLNFCLQHKEEILSGYYGINNLENFIEEIIREAESLSLKLLELTENGFNDTVFRLQMIFRPLYPSDHRIYSLQPTKAFIKD